MYKSLYNNIAKKDASDFLDGLTMAESSISNFLNDLFMGLDITLVALGTLVLLGISVMIRPKKQEVYYDLLKDEITVKKRGENKIGEIRIGELD